MALYHVTRTDSVGIGEFEYAYVIAGGTAQARQAVQHENGVTRTNVTATRVLLTSETRVLVSAHDETEDAPEALEAVTPFPDAFRV